MSHARMKTVFLHFSNYLSWSIFFIAAAVGKPGFRGMFRCFGGENLHLISDLSIPIFGIFIIDLFLNT